jgi:hypothetical protein
MNSQHSEALRYEKCAAPCIRRQFLVGRMCRTVDLDDELPRAAAEVGEVRPDRDLTGELEAVEPAVTQLRPEARFRRRGVRAQRTRTARFDDPQAAHATILGVISPGPSP